MKTHYINKKENFQFFRMPKGVMQLNISAEAKLLYMLMIDRAFLSVKNGWTDENGNAYINFKIEEVKEKLACANAKAVKLFKELEKLNLIKRRKRMGQSALIYVMMMDENEGYDNSSSDFEPIKPRRVSQKMKSSTYYKEETKNNGMDNSEISASDSVSESETIETDNDDVSENVDNAEHSVNKFVSSGAECGITHSESVQKTFDYGVVSSSESETFTVSKSNTNNNIINQNKESKTKSNHIYPIHSERWIDRYNNILSAIKRKIGYDALCSNYDTGLVNNCTKLMAEILTAERDGNCRINGILYPVELLKMRIREIDFGVLDSVLFHFERITSKIHNVKAYLTSALFNAAATASAQMYNTVQHDIYALERGEI